MKNIINVKENKIPDDLFVCVTKRQIREVKKYGVLPEELSKDLCDSLNISRKTTATILTSIETPPIDYKTQIYDVYGVDKDFIEPKSLFMDIYTGMYLYFKPIPKEALKLVNRNRVKIDLGLDSLNEMALFRRTLDIDKKTLFLPYLIIEDASQYSNYLSDVDTRDNGNNTNILKNIMVIPDLFMRDVWHIFINVGVRINNTVKYALTFSKYNDYLPITNQVIDVLSRNDIFTQPGQFLGSSIVKDNLKNFLKNFKSAHIHNEINLRYCGTVEIPYRTNHTTFRNMILDVINNNWVSQNYFLDDNLLNVI